jgi:hypothetical protein
MIPGSTRLLVSTLTVIPSAATEFLMKATCMLRLFAVRHRTVRERDYSLLYNSINADGSTDDTSSPCEGKEDEPGVLERELGVGHSSRIATLKSTIGSILKPTSFFVRPPVTVDPPHGHSTKKSQGERVTTWIEPFAFFFFCSLKIDLDP